ncbi:hypothetical protein NEDG_02083 [Nematocida displodere]|uniref:Uncharacterized protein n=1 Tax=Nematocida displodere TaxID=1805483 RepID=A0A177EJK3_9MICR|nr:hypothetical protein NEDG_02083 [Nematocida displodere]
MKSFWARLFSFASLVKPDEIEENVDIWNFYRENCFVTSPEGSNTFFMSHLSDPGEETRLKTKYLPGEEVPSRITDQSVKIWTKHDTTMGFCENQVMPVTSDNSSWCTIKWRFVPREEGGFYIKPKTNLDSCLNANGGVLTVDTCSRDRKGMAFGYGTPQQHRLFQSIKRNAQAINTQPENLKIVMGMFEKRGAGSWDGPDSSANHGRGPHRGYEGGPEDIPYNSTGEPRPHCPTATRDTGGPDPTRPPEYSSPAPYPAPYAPNTPNTPNTPYAQYAPQPPSSQAPGNAPVNDSDSMTAENIMNHAKSIQKTHFPGADVQETGQGAGAGSSSDLGGVFGRIKCTIKEKPGLMANVNVRHNIKDCLDKPRPNTLEQRISAAKKATAAMFADGFQGSSAQGPGDCGEGQQWPSGIPFHMAQQRRLPEHSPLMDNVYSC